MTVSAARMDRVKGALYGLLIADALAMPTHWYYGGRRQVEHDYGVIKGFVQPKTQISGSIMGKSNTGGAGRGGDQGSVIGDVIFHDKKKYWVSGSEYHYHQGMAAGDNTLEALLSRRVTRVLASSGGIFDVQALTSDYISFMTTPGTHNDTYCGTSHRMFFGKLSQGIPPDKCPDNDGHNVDSADSIVTTVPVALLSASDDQAAQEVRRHVAITRDSQPAQTHSAIFASSLRSVVSGSSLTEAVLATAKKMHYDVAKAVARADEDPMTA